MSTHGRHDADPDITAAEPTGAATAMAESMDARMGEVIEAQDRFPRRESTEDRVEPYVFDGELVDEREQELVKRGLRDLLPRTRATQAARVARRGGDAGREGAARAVGRVAVRTAFLVGRGHLSWAKRASDAITYAALREQIRQARLAGDLEGLERWYRHLEAAKTARRRRIRELPQTIRNLLVSVAVAIVVLCGLLLVGGIAVAFNRPLGWGWSDYWAFWSQTGNALVMAVAVLVQVGMYAALPTWLFAAYRAGRGEVPRWMVAPADLADAGATVTADGITLALAALKITALTRYVDRGGRLEFVVSPREQGGGTYCQVRLPVGVMAADLLDSKTVERFAGNLSRHKHEVYPQRDPKADARVLDLWVADKGALDRPAPEWPLLHDGEVDVWRDRLPWGVTMRSEQVAVGMLQKHWLVGATSKQGKTTVFRLLALGLALDPTVELHIADLKGDGDWSMFRDRAATLIEGGAEEHAEATCELLEWAVGEMRRRYEDKTEQGLKLTRDLSRQKGSGFHPIYLFVDECQILYGAPSPIGGTKDGDRAWRAAKTLHDQARAVNIHLLQATQRPDNRTLPVQVREGAHVRVALNVPNAEAAKMILADAADRGARPQDLRAGMDRGVLVATGEVEDIPQSQAFIIVRTHFVNGDQAAEVIARAVATMQRQGRTVNQRHLAQEPEQRDFAKDLESVLHGEVRVRTEVIRHRLCELHPGTYEGWSAPDLTAALADLDIPVRKSEGVKVIRADDVHHALTQRHQNDDSGGTQDSGT